MHEYLSIALIPDYKSEFQMIQELTRWMMKKISGYDDKKIQYCKIFSNPKKHEDQCDETKYPPRCT